jgi:hypothetical protein
MRSGEFFAIFGVSAVDLHRLGQINFVPIHVNLRPDILCESFELANNL